MKACQDMVRRISAAAIACMTSCIICAHSASDAYLTLTVEKRVPEAAASPDTVVHGQWDIALRDLNFVLGLDDNGDGRIVWRELRRHQNEIGSYAYRYIRATGDGEPCTIKPARQLVDYHADGAYAALFFDIVCKGAPMRLTFDYRMFFSIDPSHRGILVLHSGNNVATSVLSPDNEAVNFEL